MGKILRSPAEVSLVTPKAIALHLYGGLFLPTGAELRHESFTRVRLMRPRCTPRTISTVHSGSGSPLPPPPPRRPLPAFPCRTIWNFYYIRVSGDRVMACDWWGPLQSTGLCPAIINLSIITMRRAFRRHGAFPPIIA